MAEIRFDSDAMVHQMAAKPITSESASRFVSVLDKDNRPLVLCVGNNERFYALQANDTGTFIPVDLSAKLGISDKVQAFAVSQNQTSSRLHIAFATGATRLSQSTIHILDAIPPTFIDVKDEDLRRALLSNSAPPSDVRITDFHVNPSLTDKWPLLVGVWRHVQSPDDIQIARISVQEKRWEWLTELNIPQTVKDIRSICTVHTPLGESIACLYQYNNTKSIYVLTTNKEYPGIDAVVEAPIGSNPLSLAAVLDEDGNSTLLISGSGLSRITSDKLFEAGTRATIISSDPLYQTASHLAVAQTGLEDFALWFRTDDQHVLGYQRGRGNQLRDSPVPLLPSHSTADFAPLLDPMSTSQSLIVLGEKNDLTLMTQSDDTTTWKALPLMIQQLDEVMDVHAFVTHVEARDVDAMLIANEDYSLSCSGWTRALINGRESVLSSQPTVVSTNERGVITIIVPAEDITSYVYTIGNANTTKEAHRLRQSYTIDPSQKVQDRLETALKAGTPLSDIDTPEGKLLDGTAKPEDLASAEKLLKQIPDVLKDIKSKSTSGSLVSLGPIDYAALSWISKASEWWEWLKGKAKDVEKWFVEKVTGVWHFVVHIAGEVWAFVLDTAAEVFKGITWLLKKIGAALKKIWSWLSYIFNIEDIKATARSLRTLFNASLVYAESFVKSGVKPVEDWADGLEAKITEALGVHIPPDYVNQKQSPKDHATSKLGDSVSAAANVTFYHLEQGQHVGGFSFTPSGPISAIYRDIILPILQELQKDIPAVLTRLLKLFSDGKGAAMKDIMEIVATVVHALVQCLKKLVVGFIKLGGDLIHMINEVINTPFSHFPIIGPLLKLFGFDATILDIVVYVLAVPVTIFSKIITGEPPRRIDKIDYQALVEGKITDKDVLMAYSELASYIGITEAFFESLYRIYKMLTAEVPKEPETFSAIGLTFDLLVAAVTFPWDRKAPAWNFKVSIWSANLASKIVHAICLKVGATAQLSAVIEGAVAIVAFCLAQVVHHGNIDSPDKVWGDDVLIGFSVGSSVFEVIEAVSTTVGVLQPETLPYAVVAVAACGASSAVIKTGTSVREHELKEFVPRLPL